MKNGEKHTRGFFKKAVFLFVLASVTFILVYTDLLKRWDNLFYDSLIRLMERPAPEDILIIAIDDQSLNELGRWPWPRRRHAQLMEKLSHTGVKIIGFDLLFSEPDLNDLEGDALFATALAKNKRVVLPVAYEHLSKIGLTEVLPLPSMTQSAAGLGHVEILLDVDGVQRGLFLKAGLGAPDWPAFVSVMLAQAERLSEDSVRVKGREEPSPGHSRSGKNKVVSPSPYAWTGDQFVLISFSGPPGHFERVSYADVIQGRISPERFRDKYVFVGMTASGLAPRFPTPVAGISRQMPGVEVHANALDALRRGLVFYRLELMWRFLITLLFALSPVLFYFYLPPKGAFIATGVVLLMTVLMSAFFLWVFQFWIPPAVPLLAVSLCVPVLSWVRLENAAQALFREKERTLVTLHSLEFQATHDSLTALPNRYLLFDRLKHAIQKAQRNQQQLALLFLDLDDFKKVNDGYGHFTGDSLLINVVDRLKVIARAEDTIARLGGDEFVVVLENLVNEEVSATVAQKILETLKAPFLLNGHEFFVGGSIGISLHPRDGEDAETLLKNADTAMYRAKDTGRNTFQFYTEDMNARVVRRLVMEEDLRRAIKQEELELYYQLLMGVVEKQITGVECLLRWRHPEHGLIPPADFIPLAEETGLIIPIGEWVLRTACRQARYWMQLGFPMLRVAVNLSPRQFSQKDFTERVARVLNETKLDARALGFEITEGIIMKNVESAIKTLQILKSMGVHLSIDDFGTGYSSLSYLKSFPIDQLKIDQSFVRDITTDLNDAAISQAIIAMAHSMKLLVTAEGVETKAQAEFLELNGCDEMQGYYFCRPVSQDELTEMLIADGASRFMSH